MKKTLALISLLALPAVMPLLSAASVLAANVASNMGDLSQYQTIASDALALIEKNDIAGAQKRITDFETAWDAGQPTLYYKDKKAWGFVDDAADGAISSLRAKKPDAAKAKAAVKNLIAKMKNPS
ncbi:MULTISPECIES: hypothetical protein [unclassified Rhizobium]|uniref:hypothetical protein n=1 Tax=unclassified Rhizobium TaxID=2613769 RepID=UPI0038061119